MIPGSVKEVRLKNVTVIMIEKMKIMGIAGLTAHTFCTTKIE